MQYANELAKGSRSQRREVVVGTQLDVAGVYSISRNNSSRGRFTDGFNPHHAKDLVVFLLLEIFGVVEGLKDRVAVDVWISGAQHLQSQRQFCQRDL